MCMCVCVSSIRLQIICRLNDNTHEHTYINHCHINKLPGNNATIINATHLSEIAIVCWVRKSARICSIQRTNGLAFIGFHSICMHLMFTDISFVIRESELPLLKIKLVLWNVRGGGDDGPNEKKHRHTRGRPVPDAVFFNFVICALTPCEQMTFPID